MNLKTGKKKETTCAGFACINLKSRKDDSYDFVAEFYCTVYAV